MLNTLDEPSTQVDALMKDEAIAGATAMTSTSTRDDSDKIKVEDDSPDDETSNGENTVPTNDTANLKKMFDSEPPIQVAKFVPILPLSDVEKQLSAHSETRLKVGLKAYVEMGLSFAVIHDRSLFRERFGSFKQYAESWGFSPQRCYQLIQAARAHESLVHSLGDEQKMPETERAMRELLKAPEGKRAEILQYVTRDGDPTVESIAKAREALVPKKASTKAGKAKRKPAIKIDDAIKAATRWADYLDACDAKALTQQQRKDLTKAKEKADKSFKKLNIA